MDRSPRGREIEPVVGTPGDIITRGEQIETLGEKMLASADVLETIKNDSVGDGSQRGRAIESLKESIGDSYTTLRKAGQLYNAELRHARSQDALGWRLDASAVRHPAAVATVTVTLSDGAAQPLRGKALHARFERPTDKRKDVAVELEEVSAGTYAARAEPVPPGQWDLVVEVAGEDGVAFRRRHRIVLD